MAVATRIPRRRGSLCGVLLVLLGAWAALGPLVGPYFKFAYSPDTTWFYNSGRLYLSIIPGAVAALGGVAVLATRSRAAGLVGGLLAAAAGGWLIIGQPVIAILLKRPSINAGVPVLHGGGTAAAGAATTHWQLFETLGLFTGVGIVIVFLGALAMGRFSMISARDAVEEPEYGDDYLDPADDGQPQPAAVDQYAATTTHTFPGARPFPGEEPAEAEDRFPASTAGQFPSPTGQFPAVGTTQTQFPPSRGPFEPGSSSE
jgi:hypothetical protein